VAQKMYVRSTYLVSYKIQTSNNGLTVIRQQLNPFLTNILLICGCVLAVSLQTMRKCNKLKLQLPLHSSMHTLSLRPSTRIKWQKKN